MGLYNISSSSSHLKYLLRTIKNNCRMVVNIYCIDSQDCVPILNLTFCGLLLKRLFFEPLKCVIFFVPLTFIFNHKRALCSMVLISWEFYTNWIRHFASPHTCFIGGLHKVDQWTCRRLLCFVRVSLRTQQYL